MGVGRGEIGCRDALSKHVVTNTIICRAAMAFLARQRSAQVLPSTQAHADPLSRRPHTFNSKQQTHQTMGRQALSLVFALSLFLSLALCLSVSFSLHTLYVYHHISFCINPSLSLSLFLSAFNLIIILDLAKMAERSAVPRRTFMGAREREQESSVLLPSSKSHKKGSH